MSEELGTIETVESVEASGCGCGGIDLNDASPKEEELTPSQATEVVVPTPAATTAPLTTATIPTIRPTAMPNRASNYIPPAKHQAN